MATHDPTETPARELDPETTAEELGPETPAEELERLTAKFTASEAEIDTARKPLHEAIIRHLMARSAPPGKIADHTPYDRVHVGRLGKTAGVPSLRGPNAGPAPVYRDDVADAAYAELNRLSMRFQAAETQTDEDRKALHEAILRHYASRALPPGKIADHTPYDRNHISRLVKEAGIPQIRG